MFYIGIGRAFSGDGGKRELRRVQNLPGQINDFIACNRQITRSNFIGACNAVLKQKAFAHVVHAGRGGFQRHQQTGTDAIADLHDFVVGNAVVCDVGKCFADFRQRLLLTVGTGSDLDGHQPAVGVRD